jgi:CheY-like chemotaxis protein
MAHILVVDDDDQVRVLLQHMLERLGHEVTLASDGNQALERYRQKQAEVIFMDLIMPGKEGIETITDVRREFPGAKIVAMSGGGRMGPENYLDLASKLGALRTMAKPFTFAQVQQVVTEVLG